MKVALVHDVIYKWLDIYNRFNFGTKSVYIFQDSRRYSYYSNQYSKNNQSERYKRKNKTKGTGTGALPQIVALKVGAGKVNYLPQLGEPLRTLKFDL